MPKKNTQQLSPVDEQKALYEEWMADEKSDDTKLQEFYQSPRSRTLSYLEKNRGFITGSKLETFKKDQWWYKLQFVDEMPPPYDLDTTYEPFAIGSCIDDMITYGQSEVDKYYVEMERRVPDIEQAIMECTQIVEEAKNAERKKNGERYAQSIKDEDNAKIRMAFLVNCKDKTQMTPANMQLVRQMYREWQEQPLFPKQLTKKHIFFKLNGRIPVKCELDHHEPHFTDDNVGATDYFAVVDAKSCADIEKAVKFAKDNYLGQMTLYAMAAERRLIAAEDVDRPVCAIIDAVDKHGLWSRSAGIYFSPEALKDGRGALIDNIEACWRAHTTGMFFKTEEFLPSCPYYGVENYGRAKKLFQAC